MKSVRAQWARLSEFWCLMMHPEPMWPIHGHYQCRKCRRVHPVRWAA